MNFSLFIGELICIPVASTSFLARHPVSTNGFGHIRPSITGLKAFQPM